MIYLDSAATALWRPPQVVQAAAEAMCALGSASRGVHGGSLAANRTVYAAREKLAAFFGCPRPDHVIFTCNATEALNIAISGLFRPGDHVISTDLEHNSVLRPLYRLEREGGVPVDFVPADRLGRLDYGAFARLLRPETRAIVCTHASNLTGELVDIPRIGQFARDRGLLLVVDAAQTAGVFPLHMEKMGIDVLCFTGHKGLMGPQGTGGLCVRPGVEIRPWKVGGTGIQTYSPTQPEAYPTRLEAGTLNGHGIAGLSAALDFLAEKGIDSIRTRERALMERFYLGVRDLPEVEIYGDFSRERAAIVSLNLGEEDAGAVADALYQDYGIAVRAGGHCAPRMHRALGTGERGAVRFSFSWVNTPEEVDAAIRALEELSR
ncbi:MAG: aminotransferase class V-fold PLP-dependent enzyme [Oscillospiraceae bacterium]|nr:aminotransferase class V-fold PLP-dependent enzyme [Oscillospiraceae bacterium]